MRRSSRTFIGRASRAIPVALAVTSLVAGPVVAEDAPTPDPVAAATARATAEAALLNAEAARLTAEKAVIEARGKALGLPELTGKTELGDKAGVMETWILSGGAIQAAATTIAETVAKAIKEDAAKAPKEDAAEAPKGGGVIVVRSDEKLDLSLPETLVQEMKTLTRNANGVRSGGICELPKKPADKSKPTLLPESLLGSAAPALGELVSLLKVETTITGTEIEAGDALLVDAIAGQTGAWVVPSEARYAGDYSKTALGLAWTDLLAARESVLDCRDALATPKPTDAIKARVAELDRAASAIDTFAAKVTQSGDDRISILTQAAIFQKWTMGEFRILRVSVEQAGGSLMKRNHVGTALGFTTGVKLSGGLVVSYRLTDPADGSATAGGLIVCRTIFTSMAQVQAGKFGVDCKKISTPKGR